MMRVLRALILVMLACVVSCSILIDTDTAQCVSNVDCEARFPNQGLVCLGSSCLKPPIVPDGGDTDVVPPPECTKNQQCLDKLGQAALCVSNKCQPLKVVHESGSLICSEESLPLNSQDKLTSDDVLVIGGFLPLNGTGNPLNEADALAYRLALDEISAAGALEIGAGGKGRELVMALCTSEPDLVEQGLKHLTEDLKVPVVVAKFTDEKAPYYVSEYGVKKNIFMMNPSPAPYTLTQQENLNGLAWHLLGGSEDVALAYGPLVQWLEPIVRTKKGLQAGDNLKIALVTSNYSFDLSIAETIQKGPFVRTDAGLARSSGDAISFNGKSTAENEALNPKAFTTINLKSSQLGTGPTATEINQAVNDLLAFGPHLIIATTFDELGPLLVSYEQAVLSSIGPGGLPHWVLSVGNAKVTSVLQWIQDQPTIQAAQERFVGVQYAGSTRPEVRQEWLARMKAVYEKESISESVYSDRENVYDAIYWIAYGLYLGTSPGLPATGDGLALTVRKLLGPGPEIFPGKQQIVRDAFKTLKGGAGGRYIGALGPRDIDPRSGSIFGTGAVFCYQKQPGQPVTIKYDVRRYDPTTKKLAMPEPQNPEYCNSDFPPPGQ